MDFGRLSPEGLQSREGQGEMPAVFLEALPFGRPQVPRDWARHLADPGEARFSQSPQRRFGQERQGPGAKVSCPHAAYSDGVSFFVTAAHVSASRRLQSYGTR